MTNPDEENRINWRYILIGIFITIIIFKAFKACAESFYDVGEQSQYEYSFLD